MTLKQINEVLGNIVRIYNITKTYVDEDEPWLGIITAASFSILSTENRLKVYSLVQLLFGRDMVLPIKYNVERELISQQQQMQINKDNIRENIKRVNHD